MSYVVREIRESMLHSVWALRTKVQPSRREITEITKTVHVDMSAYDKTSPEGGHSNI